MNAARTAHACLLDTLKKARLDVHPLPGGCGWFALSRPGHHIWHTIVVERKAWPRCVSFWSASHTLRSIDDCPCFGARRRTTTTPNSSSTARGRCPRAKGEHSANVGSEVEECAGRAEDIAVVSRGSTASQAMPANKFTSRSSQLNGTLGERLICLR